VVAPPADLAIKKTGPAQVELGQNITYGITVTNTGIVAATNATFTDVIPSNTKFVSASSQCTASTVNAVTTLTCSVGPLAVGATSSSVSVTVTPLAVGTVKNTANLPLDRTPTDDTSSWTTTVVAPGVIAIAVDKTVDANGDGVYNDVETWKSGSTVTYKVVLHNTSTFTVHVDAMTDTINAATAAVCPNLVNTTLAAGAFSAPCTFTGSAPAAGSSIIDVVMATVSQVGNTTNKASALDTAKVVTAAANPTPHFIELDPFAKVDANGDGTFHPVETATTPGGPVTFAVQFYSSADAPMRVDKILDTADGTSAAICGSLIGAIVQPGEFSAECTYPGTAPAGTGAESIHTIVVTASEVGVPTNATSDSAPTTVMTAPSTTQQLLNMRLDKTVDANADGLYHGQETATSPSGSVMYQVQVTNLNSVAVTIDKLIDTTDGVTRAVCSGLIGMQLAPNASSGPCFFSGTAGPAGHVVVDIVQANISAVNNTSSKGIATRTARVVSAPGAPAALSLAVVKTVDANADTVFNKAETATKAGATVTYHVAIKNNSPVAVKITGATDFINGTTASVCGASLNAVLQPGASLASPCAFTSTAPAGGTSQADVVIVNAVDVNNAANATSASDTASVTSPR
jgi:uncharacterized repeat protein (TIGR01451 family)